MKKTLLSIAAALLLAGGAASAQDWQEALKKAATEAADKATGGKLTQYALVGTWNYSAPGVKFEGNDLLSQLGGSALEGTVKSQLDKVYQQWESSPAQVRSRSAKTAHSVPKWAITNCRAPIRSTLRPMWPR